MTPVLEMLLTISLIINVVVLALNTLALFAFVVPLLLDVLRRRRQGQGAQGAKIFARQVPGFDSATILNSSPPSEQHPGLTVFDDMEPEQDFPDFPFLSSYDDPTESVRAELVAAGIEPSAMLDVQVTSNGDRAAGDEADGVVGEWSLRRYWCYWAAVGLKLSTTPKPIPADFRSSIRWQGVANYYIDTPAALRVFVEAVK